MAISYTVSIESRKLLDDFKRACKGRGHSQAYVVSSAMRWFIEHPHAHGWTNGEEAKKKKAKVEIKKRSRS